MVVVDSMAAPPAAVPIMSVPAAQAPKQAVETIKTLPWKRQPRPVSAPVHAGQAVQNRPAALPVRGAWAWAPRLALGGVSGALAQHLLAKIPRRTALRTPKGGGGADD